MLPNLKQDWQAILPLKKCRKILDFGFYVGFVLFLLNIAPEMLFQCKGGFMCTKLLHKQPLLSSKALICIVSTMYIYRGGPVFKNHILTLILRYIMSKQTYEVKSFFINPTNYQWDQLETIRRCSHGQSQAKCEMSL